MSEEGGGVTGEGSASRKIVFDHAPGLADEAAAGGGEEGGEAWGLLARARALIASTGTGGGVGEGEGREAGGTVGAGEGVGEVGERGVMPPRTPVRRAFGLRRGAYSAGPRTQARTRSAGVLLFSGVDGEGGVVDIGVGEGRGGDKTWSEKQVGVRER